MQRRPPVQPRPRSTDHGAALETEIDGIPPWRRATVTGAGTIKRASANAFGSDPS
jgi:hypothetical protein